MNPFLFHWQLSLSQPLAAEEQTVPAGFVNPVFDIHAAVHLGILLGGDLSMKHLVSEEGMRLKPLPLELFLTSPWQLHGNAVSRNGAKLLLFTFLPEAVMNCVPGGERQNVRRLLYTPPNWNCTPFLLPEMKAASRQLAAEHEMLKKNFPAAVAERKIWLKLVDFLCDAAAAQPESGQREAGGKFARIAPVFEALASRRQVPLSPARAAEICCLSESYFHHVFKACMGISFSLYELYFRLNGAAADLAAGAEIKEIASDWGFCDTSHFSGAFKRHFGIPPSQYRKQR
ncbi:MAG: helix-turn-helix transcriptional regulator [Lentisphaeria bacterium]|nr:helix-turn-helix transcriptional regulator [Lentisphaeria bacterium]